jgi:DNA-binding NarL/FixJ family response regulator
MPIRVLIVDDDAAYRAAARHVLAAKGLVVAGEAATLEEGRRSVAALRPDAVLLDVGLPDGSGVHLAAELAGAAGPPRVLLTSTDASAVTRRLLARCGARFVPKADLPGADLVALLS